jgi:hypothetical protein
LQEQPPNPLELRWLRAIVVSIKSKGPAKTGSGVNPEGERKRTAEELSKGYHSDVKTGDWFQPREKSGRSLPTARATSGTEAARAGFQALSRNMRTCRPDVKGAAQAGEAARA